MGPNEWQLSNFSDLQVEIIDGDRGNNYPKSSDYLTSGHCLFLGAKNVINDRIDLSEPVFLSEEKHKKLRKGVVQYGDLLLIMRGNGTGRVALYDESIPFSVARINSGLAIIRPSSLVSREYLTHLMRSRVIIGQFKSFIFGSAQPQLTIKILKSIKFPAPSIREQRKIANILTTWDKAIKTVEQLIKNSRAQKKSLMQQLLTGKRRLPDFNEKWKDRFLTDIAQIIVSPVDKKSVQDEFPVELCNYTDVYYNTRITRQIEFMKATAKQSEIDKYTLQINDVVITKDSETPAILQCQL